MYRDQATCSPNGNNAVAQFDHENGPDRIFHRQKVYFANGAWRDNASLPGLCPPSVDPIERKKAIIRYHGLLLKIHTDQFDEFKHKTLELNASVSTEAVAQLKTLQKAVLNQRKLLEGLRAELKELELAPEMKAFTQRVSPLEDALEDAKTQLQEAEDAGCPADELDILEDKILNIEFSIGIQCKNLHRIGGTPPKHLLRYLHEALNRETLGQAAEARRRTELRSIAV